VGCALAAHQGAGQQESGRKIFFFEKKKQKTFDRLG
jgi:hypothetical protein